MLAAIAIGLAEGGERMDGDAVPSVGDARSAAPRRVVEDDGVTLDDQLDFLRETFAPAAVTVFDDLRHDLRAAGSPLPLNVRRLLAPFFTDQSAGAVRLTPAAIERAVFVVDAERMRAVFAMAPREAEAITVGDVIAFSAGTYRPDCIEGVALIGHELVHVVQYAALGKEAFLDRYFLKDTLRQLLTGDGSADALAASHNTLEAAAYCHQERICHALARAGELQPCGGRTTARCATCPRDVPAQRDASGGASGRKPVPTR